MDIHTESSNINIDKCSFCNLHTETVEHMLYSCTVTQNLWNDIFHWIYIKTGLRIAFTHDQILLGSAPMDLDIFNLIFLIVKRYIYVCKCLKTIPNKYAAIYKIKDNFITEEECFRIFPNKFNINKALKWEILRDLFV